MDVERPDLKKRKKFRQRAIVVAAIAVVTVLAIAAFAFGASSPTVKQSDILIDTVKRGEFVRAVRGPGKLVPSQMRWIIARTEANVEKILMRPGAKVGPNSVILELSNPEVQDRLLAAKAAFKAAEGDHKALQAEVQARLLEIQSDLAAVEGDYESAQVEEQASRRAYDSGVMAEVQYKKTAIDVRQLQVRMRLSEQRVAQFKSNMNAQIAASDARLEQLRRTQELRQLEADSLQIRAGLDGVVQQVQVEEGQRVTAGFNLARVARPSTLIAELRIPESQAADLNPGQTATIEIGRSQVAGKVRRFNPVVEKGTILVEVELTEALPTGVRSEQSIDGVIYAERIEDALFVGRPVNSSPQAEATVFRLVGSGEAERVPVRFGKESVSSIQVLSGLKEGDRVIISDMSKFDGSHNLSVE